MTHCLFPCPAGKLEIIVWATSTVPWWSHTLGLKKIHSFPKFAQKEKKKGKKWSEIELYLK